jgi:hypothetical protein
MDKAMKSAEMSAAAEDAKRFLDMTRTYAMVVPFAAYKDRACH